MTFSGYCESGNHTTCRWGSRCECHCHDQGATGKRLHGTDSLMGWPPAGYQEKTDGRIFGYGPRPFAREVA